jgi:hypothetical protein
MIYLLMRFNSQQLYTFLNIFIISIYLLSNNNNIRNLNRKLSNKIYTDGIGNTSIQSISFLPVLDSKEKSNNINLTYTVTSGNRMYTPMSETVLRVNHYKHNPIQNMSMKKYSNGIHSELTRIKEITKHQNNFIT